MDVGGRADGPGYCPGDLSGDGPPQAAAGGRPRPSALRVPVLDGGRRNLALLPGAKANASSVWADGAMPIHQIAHLNDGRYGNSASWIAKTTKAWAEIDLGASYTISRVRLSNDAAKQYSDRKAVDYRVLVATEYDARLRRRRVEAGGAVSAEPLLGIREFSFPPCQARWVRVQIDRSAAGRDYEPRLDEIEIYEDQPLAAKDVAAWKSQSHRPMPRRCKVGQVNDLPGLEGLSRRSRAAPAGQLRRRRRVPDVRRQLVSGRLRRSRRTAIPSRLPRKTICGRAWNSPAACTKSTRRCSSKCTT